MLFVAFVAILCSIGVCTNWFISLAVLLVTPLGIVLTRAKEGIIVGGAQFFLIELVPLSSVPPCLTTTRL